MHRPLQPPHLSRNEAKARTTIAQRGNAIPLRLGDALWHANFSPLLSAEAIRPKDWWVALDWAGAAFFLQLPETAAHQIVAPLVPGTPLPELPQELALAVLEAALSDVIVALQSVGRGAPRLLQMHQNGKAPDACQHALALNLRGPAGTSAVSAVLHADSLGLMLLAGLMGKRPLAPPILDAQLLLSLPAEIGFTYLSIDLLSTLSLGDVVLMDRCHIDAERVLWLSADGAAGLHVHLPSLEPAAEAQPATTPTLIVTQAWSTAMPTEVPPDTNASSIDAVPIRLSFDLGEVTLTVAEARALQPGQVIHLTRPFDSVVRIRANGAQVGEGDLVEIDGQLGVSVRMLFSESEKDAEVDEGEYDELDIDEHSDEHPDERLHALFSDDEKDAAE